MSIRVNGAIHSLRGALSDINFPKNPVVEDAIRIIEAYCEGECKTCWGQGKIRVNVCQDDMRGDIVACHKCKGTGRE
jgi:hypothetical protein